MLLQSRVICGRITIQKDRMLSHGVYSPARRLSRSVASFQTSDQADQYYSQPLLRPFHSWRGSKSLACGPKSSRLMKYRDEAFEMGRQWAYLYPEGSASRTLIEQTMENSYLVNIVANDFKDGQCIFEPFLLDQQTSPASTNGANGVIPTLVNSVNGVKDAVLGAVNGALTNGHAATNGHALANGH